MVRKKHGETHYQKKSLFEGRDGQATWKVMILKAGGHNGTQMQRIRRRQVITGEENLMGHVGQRDAKTCQNETGSERK